MDTIDDAVATAENAWRAYGVTRADRAVLAADLRSELAAAVADGITPAQLLGDDVPGLARRLADEAGVARVPAEYGRVVRTALAGAVAGTVLGYLAMMVIYPVVVHLVDLPRSYRVPLLLAVAVYYGIPAALLVAGAVVAVRTRLRDLPRIRATATRMLLLMPAAGIVVTPLTIAYAWATGFSTVPTVVALEIALVVGAIIGATMLARRWAVRDPAPAPLVTAG
ncbi:hypothetical protein O7608_19870 [Solwaraspora sp. WMMA2056]|uniref:hypothetical protein n=1 Tax=Solwaraspora sp. WMMA2056 TaxID=3015161 RepID=UPI00259BD7B7|nr:hypothetical protein [Solwaraspora sp. WMMA2056]WJK38751.1 hypothetical protein O7608_19870 [Solwaraspora sp. WMMA2056]